MNLITITGTEGGAVILRWQDSRGQSRQLEPASFTNPMDGSETAELRWYLEEYLQFPYGAEEERAGRVEARMEAWGESLFTQVFLGGDPKANPPASYQEAVREGLGRCEICISSDDPDFLNIPWELLRDPAPGRGFLALLLAGLYRRRSGQAVQKPAPPPGEGPFRMLLVVARPSGETYIPLSTMARPLLDAARPLRPRIELDVLRPPTFAALTKRLDDMPGHYHLVHFDGHGAFSSGASTGGTDSSAAVPERGLLVFEYDDGTPHDVSSHEVGNLLAGANVPTFILNACQSAQEGSQDPYSSVAAQLVAVGSNGVVAMSYSVYAETAAIFVGRLYERLIAHDSLSQAVAAARKALYANPRRNSVVGPLELRDWIVPALYQNVPRYVPISEEAELPEDLGEGEEPLATVLERAQAACPEGPWGFVGRDYDILMLERALLSGDQPWVILTGIGGGGKTALAYGFARWFAETGGCPGGVFATSFKEQANIGQVIGSIAGFGQDFSRLPDDEQWQVVISYLRDNACLLVWDNFETVTGYPQGATPLANEEQQRELAQFLRDLKGGESRVLITTRKPDEEWLQVEYTLVELSGLVAWEAAELAEAILRTVGKKPEDYRGDPDYVRLLRLLLGHPRSMEVVLRQLRRKAPGEIIEALQHRIEALDDVLDASLEYVFAQLSEPARRHLPILGLFVSFVHRGTLADLASYGRIDQSPYEVVMGATLDGEGCELILEEAARAGLIQPRSAHIYELHPTLPQYLRRRLAHAVGRVAFANSTTHS